MSKKRKKRRADGSLRPAVARRRARERGLTYEDPQLTARFRGLICNGTAIWNSRTLREQTGLDFEELAERMEYLAEHHRWAKLRDDEGHVKAIGLPRNHRERSLIADPDHRAAMLHRIETA